MCILFIIGTGRLFVVSSLFIKCNKKRRRYINRMATLLATKTMFIFVHSAIINTSAVQIIVMENGCFPSTTNSNGIATINSY
jgi:hypothetical protein